MDTVRYLYRDRSHACRVESVCALAHLARSTAPDAPAGHYLDRYLADSRILLPHASLLIALLTLSRAGASPPTTGAPERIVTEPPVHPDWLDTSVVRTRLTPGADERRYLESAWRTLTSVDRVLARTRSDSTPTDRVCGAVMERAVADTHVARFIDVNRYEGVTYFNRERYGELVSWTALIMALRALEDTLCDAVRVDLGGSPGALPERNRRSYRAAADGIVRCVRAWISARNASNYRVDELLGALRSGRR